MALLQMNFYKRVIGSFIIILCFLGRLCAGSTNFHIKPNSPITLETGENKILTCTTPRNYTGVQWQGPNGTDLTYSNTTETMVNHYRIRLENVTINLSGKYICKARNEKNKSVSKNVIVVIYEPIGFFNLSTKQAFEIGKEARVTWLIKGHPAPNSVQFTNNKGKTINEGNQTGDRMYIEKPRNNNNPSEYILVIKNLKSEDEGNYKCKIFESSQGQEVAENVYVDVQYPPKNVTIKPKQATQYSERDLTLKCTADANPDPNFEWYKGNITLNETNSILILTNLTSKDSGKYFCVVRNKYSNESGIKAEGSVQVYVPPKVKITHSPTIVTENSTINITCKAEGYPIPDVQLRKNGELVNSAKATAQQLYLLSHELGEITLTIGKVFFDDSANYTCTATSSFANALTHESSDTLELKVLYKPRWVLSSSTTYQACLNTRKVLTCKFHGEPKPVLTWMKKPANSTKGYLKIRQTSNQTSVGENEMLTLVIENVEESNFTNYFCHAKNSQGEKYEKVKLIKATTPQPPTKLRVRNQTITTKEADVRFHLPLTDTEVNLLKFTLYISNLKSNQTKIENSDKVPENQKKSQKIVYSLKNLTPDTYYSVAVSVSNCFNESKRSEKVFFHTKPIRNPGKVNILSDNVSEFPNNYTIEWDFGDDGGGAWQKMKIKYMKISNGTTNEAVIQGTELNSGKISYTITGLSPATNYTVTVIIYNEAGSAPRKFTFKTATAPDDDASDRGTNELVVGKLSLTVIIIAISMLIVIFFIIDLVFGILKHCGLSYFLYHSFCASSNSAVTSKDPDPEQITAKYKKEPESEVKSLEGATDKKPLAENAQPIANGTDHESEVFDEETPLQTGQSVTEMKEGNHSQNDRNPSSVIGDEKEPRAAPKV